MDTLKLKFFRTSPAEEKIIGILVLSFPIFLLTIKGWSNAIAILLFLISLFGILRSPKMYFPKNNPDIWVRVCILSCPLVAEIFAQMGRLLLYGEEFSIASLDGPSRFFLAAVVYFYLTQKSKLDFSQLLSVGCLLSLCVTFISIFFFREHYWVIGPIAPPRAATYFVDPITLSVYSVALLALSWGAIQKIENPLIKITVVLALLYMAAFILVASISRSAWLGFGFLCLLLGGHFAYEKKWSPWLGVICLLMILTLIVIYLEPVRERLALLWTETLSYVNGKSKDTSIGLRLALIRIDWVLFCNRPFLGFPEGILPAYDYLLTQIPELTELAYSQKLLTGSHMEIFAQIAHRGVFGALTFFCVFLYPLHYFYVSVRRSCGRASDKFKSGLSFIGVMIIAGVGIQVLNLKMTSTFCALVLAVLFLGRAGDRPVRAEET